MEREEREGGEKGKGIYREREEGDRETKGEKGKG